MRLRVRVYCSDDFSSAGRACISKILGTYSCLYLIRPFFLRFVAVNITHHERANCKFPSWLTDHHTWHLLDHSKTYHFSSHNGTVRVTYDRDRSENVLEMRAVCNSILASSEGQIIISAHITVGW